jgi:hypothetical protein
MVRWNAGTEHVKTQRQTLSPAGPKIEIQKKKTGDRRDFLSFFPSNMGVAAPPDGGSNCIRLKVTKA